MAQRHIIKTINPNGIPSRLEIDLWEMKHDCNIQHVQRLYVAFKQGKRRKIKRLRVNEYKSYPCELCGSHTYLDAVVGRSVLKLYEIQQREDKHGTMLVR